MTTGAPDAEARSLTARLSLAEKTAVVTGASSGIGRSIAESMAEAGASVVLVGRHGGRLTDVERAIAVRGGDAINVEVNLCDGNAATRIVAAALSAFGSIDVLVHAAGIFFPEPFAETTLERLDEQWAVNVRAPFQLTQAALPHLRSGSSVIFLSSIAGHIGFPNSAAYCASKGAVELLVKALGIELAERGIRVNAIAPGNVRTPMNEHLLADPDYERQMIAATPARMIGSVEQIAPIAVLLASEAGSFMVGSSILADGGWTAA